MRISSSSSLLFATLAISSSSSSLAAPAGEGHSSQSDAFGSVSGRRGSLMARALRADNNGMGSHRTFIFVIIHSTHLTYLFSVSPRSSTAGSRDRYSSRDSGRRKYLEQHSYPRPHRFASGEASREDIAVRFRTALQRESTR